MKPAAILFALCGLAGVTALVVWQGAGAVLEATLAIGWGLVLVIVYEAVPIVVDARAWGYLIDAGERPSWPAMVRARWLRQSVNQLLPAVPVGGQVVGARLLSFSGVPGARAGASVVIDVSLGAATQMLFVLIGVAVLVSRDPDSDLALPLLLGTALLSAGIGTFVFLQHKGLFGYLAARASSASRGLIGWVGGAESMDRAIRAIYARRGDLLRNAVWQMLAWFAGVGEVWIALWFLGHPVSIGDAVILQSLSRGMRSAAFFVPGGLGVQEGGLVLLAGVVGLAPETGLALALVKRVRELAVGTPGLLVWQAIESRRLLVRGASE